LALTKLVARLPSKRLATYSCSCLQRNRNSDTKYSSFFGKNNKVK
jgi:hypothetical protein